MQTAKYCGHCGAKLPEGARFCGMCRAEVSVPGVTEAPQTLDPALRVGEPSVSMNTYPSDDVIEIGRSRTKLFWVLCVSLVFLGLGIWLLSYATVSLIMAIVGVLTLLLAIGGTIAITMHPVCGSTVKDLSLLRQNLDLGALHGQKLKIIALSSCLARSTYPSG